MSAATSHPVVDAYVEAVNAADLDRLLALFSDAARLDNPVGTYVGAAEIGGFYRDVVLAGEARLTVSSVSITSGDDGGPGAVVTARLAAGSPLDPSATLVATDVFTLDDDGRIRALVIIYD